MTSSLQRLPGRRLEEALQSSRRAALEAKGRQRTSGKSGQLSYLVDSEDEWDAVVQLPTSTVTVAAYVYVEFDASYDWPIASVVDDIRLNGVDEANKIQPLPPGGQVTHGITIGGGSITLRLPFEVDADVLQDSRVLRWRVTIWHSGDATLYVKTRLRSSSPGALTLTVTDAEGNPL